MSHSFKNADELMVASSAASSTGAFVTVLQPRARSATRRGDIRSHGRRVASDVVAAKGKEVGRQPLRFDRPRRGSSQTGDAEPRLTHERLQQYAAAHAALTKHAAARSSIGAGSTLLRKITNIGSLLPVSLPPAGPYSPPGAAASPTSPTAPHAHLLGQSAATAAAAGGGGARTVASAPVHTVASALATGGIRVALTPPAGVPLPGMGSPPPRPPAATAVSTAALAAAAAAAAAARPGSARLPLSAGVRATHPSQRFSNFLQPAGGGPSAPPPERAFGPRATDYPSRSPAAAALLRPGRAQSEALVRLRPRSPHAHPPPPPPPPQQAQPLTHLQPQAQLQPQPRPHLHPPHQPLHTGPQPQRPSSPHGSLSGAQHEDARVAGLTAVAAVATANVTAKATGASVPLSPPRRQLSAPQMAAAAAVEAAPAATQPSGSPGTGAAGPPSRGEVTPSAAAAAVGTAAEAVTATDAAESSPHPPPQPPEAGGMAAVVPPPRLPSRQQAWSASGGQQRQHHPAAPPQGAVVDGGLGWGRAAHPHLPSRPQTARPLTPPRSPHPHPQPTLHSPQLQPTAQPPPWSPRPGSSAPPPRPFSSGPTAALGRPTTAAAPAGGSHSLHPTAASYGAGPPASPRPALVVVGLGDVPPAQLLRAPGSLDPEQQLLLQQQQAGQQGLEKAEGWVGGLWPGRAQQWGGGWDDDAGTNASWWRPGAALGGGGCGDSEASFPLTAVTDRHDDDRMSPAEAVVWLGRLAELEAEMRQEKEFRQRYETELQKLAAAAACLAGGGGGGRGGRMLWQTTTTGGKVLTGARAAAAAAMRHRPLPPS